MSLTPQAKLGLGSAALGGATSLVTGFAQMVAERARFFRQQEENRKAYERQRQDYLADRLHDERYNSPEQQKNRLRSAGLNPLQYMDSPAVSDSATNASAMTPAEAPNYSGGLSDIGNSGIIAMQSAMQSSQILENLQNVYGKKKNNEILNATANELIRSVKLNNDLTFRRTNEALARCNLLSSQTKNQDLKNIYDQAANPLLLRSLELQNGLADIDLQSGKIHLSYADRECAARLRNMWADTQLKLAEKDESIARTFKVKQDAQQAAEAFGLSLELMRSNMVLNWVTTGKVNAEAEGIRINNRFLNSTFDTRAKQMELDFKQATRDYKWSGVKNAMGVLRDAGVGIGAVMGGAGTFLGKFVQGVAGTSPYGANTGTFAGDTGRGFSGWDITR